MNAHQTCPHCSGKHMLCAAGQRTLLQRLTALPGLYDDLQVVLQRQVRFSTAGRRTDAEVHQPLPFNAGASKSIDAVTDLLRRYIRLLRKETPAPFAMPPEVPTRLGLQVRWLCRHMPNTWAHLPNLYRDLADVTHDAVKITDTPTTRTYLGVCGASLKDGTTCLRVVWGEPGADFAECDCTALHPVASRSADVRQRVIGDLDDRIMTATDAAEALVASDLMHGDPIKLAARIRRLASPRPPVIEGGDKRPARLLPKTTLHRPGSRGRPGYRVGDILTLLKGTTA